MLKSCELQPWWLLLHGILSSTITTCISIMQTLQIPHSKRGRFKYNVSSFSCCFAQAVLSPFLISLLLIGNFLTVKMSPAKICARPVSVTPSKSSPSSLNCEEQETTSKYVADILKCYDALVALPHLQPSLAVNQSFSQLVEICAQIPEESIAYAVCILLYRCQTTTNVSPRYSKTHRSSRSYSRFKKYAQSERATSKGIGLRK
jgi:hypothetical protein